MKILVTGGTGQVGSQVVRELKKRGADLRVLVRRGKERDPSLKGLDLAIGDLLDPTTVRRALEGVEKLYLLNAVSPDELTQGLIAYDLARRAKLTHIVYHSVFRVDHFRDVPHFAAKGALESTLCEFDVPFTILRPGYFFQNDLSLEEPLIRAGVYPVPLGAVGISLVDVRDIAEAAAIALTGDGHHGKVYDVVGPDVLSGPQLASIWSSVLGRDVRYGGHDFDAFEEQMRKQGAPPWASFDIRTMFQRYLERGFAAEPSSVEAMTSLLGHPPRTYRDFAQEAALEWRRRAAAAGNGNRRPSPP